MWIHVLQLKAGQIFNIEAGKKALRNINSLALFSNIEVNPRPDEENDGGIVVEVKLKELEQRTAEVSTEWSIVPGSSGRPTLVSSLFIFKDNGLLLVLYSFHNQALLLNRLNVPGFFSPIVY